MGHRLFTLIALFALVSPRWTSAQTAQVSTLATSNLIVGDIAVGRDGTIYIAGGIGGSTIYQISPQGEGSVFATAVSGPGGLTIGADGDLYVAEYKTGHIERFSPAGELIERWETGIEGPVGIEFDAIGNLYITHFGVRINGAPANGHSIYALRPDGSIDLIVRDERLIGPVDLAFDERGHSYIVNGFDGRVFRYSAESGLELLADVAEAGALGWVAYLNGALYSSSYNKHTLYRIDLDGNFDALNDSILGSTNGDLSQARFNGPNGIAANPAQNTIYLTEANAGRLRQIALPLTTSTAETTWAEIKSNKKP